MSREYKLIAELMKIVIIPSWYPTEENFVRGVFFREQALALHRANYKVAVLTPPYLRSLRLVCTKFGGWKSGINIENDEGMTTYRWYGWSWIPRCPRINLMLSLQAGHKMFEDYIYEFGKPDLIHAHSAFPGGILAIQIKNKYDIPAVVTEHSSLIAKGEIQPWKKKLISDVYLYADQRIVVSPKLGEILRDQYSEKFDSWSYIPNIVDHVFTSSDVLHQSKSESAFCFLNIGSLTENKGQIDLLHAFAQGFQGNHDVELRIGGVGPIRSELEQLADDLNIREQVVFLGLLTREQVLHEMQQANVFVLSSHFETFGVVLVEALACGKSVIATACGGPECIVNEQNGLLVPAQEPDHLSTAMQQIYENFCTYSPTEIRNDCLARFGESVVIDQLSKTYNTVLDR